MMLATGLRIGETAAIVWDALDLNVGTVEVRGTVVRLRGRVSSSSRVRSRRMGGARSCCRRGRSTCSRVGGTDAEPTDPVFGAPLGGLRDPSNTAGDLREAFDQAGYEWVTSHVYRKTVATLMDEAGLSARAAADQLGQRRCR